MEASQETWLLQNIFCNDFLRALVQKMHVSVYVSGSDRSLSIGKFVAKYSSLIVSVWSCLLFVLFQVVITILAC